MSDQYDKLQLNYQGMMPAHGKLVWRRYKWFGSEKMLSLSYYEKLECLGFTSSEVKSFEQSDIRRLFAEEIRTDKLNPMLQGRFGTSLAVEDFLANASFLLGRQDLACGTQFGQSGDGDATEMPQEGFGSEPEVQTARFTPETVLQELCDLSITDSRRRELVIQAELLRFGEAQKPELLSVLRDFIGTWRCSDNLDDLVAVGSAIRKYMANIETSNIGTIATLLAASHAGTVPLELKLEIVKMIFRSFEADPPGEPDPEPQLAECVYGLARAYLNPNVLPDGKNATVAMYAVQALVAMRSQRASEALATVSKLPQEYQWFREQLGRRLINLRERWSCDPTAARALSRLLSSVDEQ